MAIIYKLCAAIMLALATWCGPISAEYDQAAFQVSLAAVMLLMAHEASA